MKYKWTKPVLALLLMGLSTAQGQTTFNTIEYLDINRFNVGHLVHGDMWRDATSGKDACEYPKGSGKYAGGLAAIWTSASDASGKDDYVAAQMFRSSGVDFWPGPLDLGTGACTYETSQAWARIWKVNQSDIVTFRGLTLRTMSTVPKDILEWPAKGNVYAIGNGGAPLPDLLSKDMAPFVDTDGDGLYDPLKGDYPRIKGDQMLWWIVNDNCTASPKSSKGTPMRLEYRVSAYAYNRGGILDNTVYYEFDIVNTSHVNYIDFRMGLVADVDMGYPFDDYIASDSVYRMGIVYDGTAIPGAYLLGLSIVEQPGDVYPNGMQPAGAFSYFENTLTGPRRDPRNVADFRNYMHGNTADGIPYPDSPMEFPISKGAMMCDETYPLTDRRFYLNTRGFGFPAGGGRKVAMALIATDTTGNACGALDFKALTDIADSAWIVYYNPLPALSTKEIAVLDQKLRIFPNPAASVILIDSYTGRTLKAEQLTVYDATGRLIHVPIQQSNRQIHVDVNILAAGVYSLVYRDGDVQATQQFVKQ